METLGHSHISKWFKKKSSSQSGFYCTPKNHLSDSVTWTDWPSILTRYCTEHAVGGFTVYHSANRHYWRPVMLTMLLYDHVLSDAVTIDHRAPVLQVWCHFCRVINSAGTIFEPLIVFVTKSETTKFLCELFMLCLRQYTMMISVWYTL